MNAIDTAPATLLVDGFSYRMTEAPDGSTRIERMPAGVWAECARFNDPKLAALFMGALYERAGCPRQEVTSIEMPFSGEIKLGPVEPLGSPLAAVSENRLPDTTPPTKRRQRSPQPQQTASYAGGAVNFGQALADAAPILGTQALADPPAWLAGAPTPVLTLEASKIWGELRIVIDPIHGCGLSGIKAKLGWTDDEIAEGLNELSEAGLVHVAKVRGKIYALPTEPVEVPADVTLAPSELTLLDSLRKKRRNGDQVISITIEKLASDTKLSNIHDVLAALTKKKLIYVLDLGDKATPAAIRLVPTATT